MCNVTLRRVHETIFAVESSKYYIFLCVCSLTYIACHEQGSYFLRPPWLRHIFRHFLTNGMIFGKKSLNTKCVFYFIYFIYFIMPFMR